MRTRFRRSAVIFIFVATAAAGDIPRAPRIASSPGGGILAGCQIESGDDGEFELFSAPDGGAAASLGRYHGQLAGVAIGGYDERCFGLTRDGVLSVYGDDAETLALGDGRWRMLDLAWFDGAPAGLDHSNGVLSLAAPDLAAKGWREETEFIAADPDVGKAVLVPLDGELHALWSGRSRDLSRGALRHMVRRDGLWSELPSIPLGGARTFTAFRREDGMALVAVVPDPVNEQAPPRLTSHFWRAGEWLKEDNPPREVAGRLPDILGIAGTWAAGHDHWLIAGVDGCFIAGPRAPGGRDGDSRPSAALLVRGLSPEAGWPEIVSLAFAAAFFVLAAFYCRRSRQMSLLLPGRPPDLASRGMALIIDWTLVSVGMTAYHLAAGDIRIHHELLTLGGVNEMFWMNMAALIVFSAAAECAYGRTPGKWLTGMRVRSALGGPPGFLQCLFRNAMRGVDMFPLVFPGVVGAVVALFNPRRQRLGDILGGTVVRRHAPFPRRSFILASASPRRRELLTALGVDVKVEPPEIDEGAFQGGDPGEAAKAVAEAKAKRVADRTDARMEIVVAADTVVVLDGRTLGKPRDAADARRMLGELSGRSHTVITGVAVWDAATGQGMSDIEATEVEFRPLSAREMDEYVASGEPMDKAGAYGVQTGFLVKEVRGSLSNVAGLPMEMLQNMLAALDS